MDPVQYIADQLGISQATLALLIPLIILVSNYLSRAIPDDSVGVMGVLNKVFKVLGLYLSSRVTSGVSVDQIAKVAAGTKALDSVPKLAESIDTALHDGLNEPAGMGLEAMQAAKELFPGVTRGPDGKFQKKDATLKSHWLSAVGTFLMVAVMFGLLSGCATMTASASYMCKNEQMIRTATQLGIFRALSEPDPVKRETLLSAYAITNAALDKCRIAGAR